MNPQPSTASVPFLRDERRLRGAHCSALDACDLRDSCVDHCLDKLLLAHILSHTHTLSLSHPISFLRGWVLHVRKRAGAREGEREEEEAAAVCL